EENLAHSCGREQLEKALLAELHGLGAQFGTTCAGIPLERSAVCRLAALFKEALVWKRANRVREADQREPCTDFPCRLHDPPPEGLPPHARRPVVAQLFPP